MREGCLIVTGRLVALSTSVSFDLRVRTNEPLKFIAGWQAC